ncbi:MAG TPA: cupredoxin domain-containing protein [Candidatus Paceibacterota bacterium]|jgi:cytochrome c oxidase subunit 2|nr:cupredoxin domain-containing protein [Candidatus Paceibacterota bacterium]
MNKTVISIIVLVLVIGGLFFVLKSKKSEAPVVDENQVGTTTDAEGNIIPISTVTTTTTTEQTTTIDEGVKEFTVTGKNFSFSPSTITVNKGDKVKITFKNTEGMHNFIIDEFGAATKTSQSPDTEVIEFTATKTGSFEYYCSVGNHRAMGMKGSLVVKSQ